MADKLATGKRRFVILWAVLIVAIYTAYTGYVTRHLQTVRDTAAARHAARLDPVRADPGKTPPDPLPAANGYATVRIGTYIDRIESMSIRDSSWLADFYVWFRWSGDPRLDPGGTIQVIDGQIESKDLMDEYHAPDGTNYQRYRIVARITKFFDIIRFPLEDHMLNLYLEDKGRDNLRLRYVVDEGLTRISSRVQIPGYQITGFGETIKSHTYKSTYGDPRLPENLKKIFTQYILGIKLNRPGFGLYLKIFLALFAAIALAMSIFFIKPTDVDPRFGLSAGAFFGAVANIYLANSLLPEAGTFGLIDYVNGLGLFTIFFGVAESIISLHLWDRREDPAFSQALDKATFWTLAPSYLLANIAIPLAAYLN